MGSGSGVLRQGMPPYVEFQRHLRLERPNRPYHHQIIVISVSRIPGFPPVELEEADAMMMSTSSNSYDDDYDYQNYYLNEGADIRYRW